jgi:CIC family chloride channel protein
MAEDLLHKLPPTVVSGQSLRELEQVFSQWRWQHTYVIDDKARFLGAISLHDFRHAIQDSNDLSSPFPDSIVKPDYPTVLATSAIWQVMDVFMQHPGERLPVLDPEHHLLGFVVKSDLIRMCREYLASA